MYPLVSMLVNDNHRIKNLSFHKGKLMATNYLIFQKCILVCCIWILG